MTNPKTADLIAQAREVAGWMTPSDGHIADVLNWCADALEAAVQSHAVDREALKNALGVALANAYDDDSVVLVEESVAAQLVASGVLQDAREVEARGLERFAAIIDDWDPLVFDTPSGSLGRAVDAAHTRAQQIREGKK